MSNKEHRLGVSEVNLVDRHLMVHKTGEVRILEAIAEINEIYGLDEVSFDERTLVLNLAYDASKVCIDRIEEVLEKHNIEISHDWWTHFKAGYYRYVDENLMDNASHEPFSCHKVPPHK